MPWAIVIAAVMIAGAIYLQGIWDRTPRFAFLNGKFSGDLYRVNVDTGEVIFCGRRGCELIIDERQLIPLCDGTLVCRPPEGEQ